MTDSIGPTWNFEDEQILCYLSPKAPKNYLNCTLPPNLLTSTHPTSGTKHQKLHKVKSTQVPAAHEDEVSYQGWSSSNCPVGHLKVGHVKNPPKGNF